MRSYCKFEYLLGIVVAPDTLYSHEYSVRNIRAALHEYSVRHMGVVLL